MSYFSTFDQVCTIGTYSIYIQNVYMKDISCNSPTMRGTLSKALVLRE